MHKTQFQITCTRLNHPYDLAKKVLLFSFYKLKSRNSEKLVNLPKHVQLDRYYIDTIRCYDNDNYRLLRASSVPGTFY